MSFPQYVQSQIAFSMCFRSRDVKVASYLGPSTEAAVMCAATPTLTVVFATCPGPEVLFRQSGLEQRWLTRSASIRLSFLVKSSRIATRISLARTREFRQTHPMTNPLEIRKNYVLGVLEESNANPDPTLQLRVWLEDATNAGVQEPNAMSVVMVRVMIGAPSSTQARECVWDGVSREKALKQSGANGFFP